ncbi:MAG: type II secretion system minor pseudopilin GspH [Gammaproteobacteria bacterium]|nr:type II secretion system minor pseudopilin GspH [Gammaproteobacteria bacterium]
MKAARGFTLLELLVVLGIVGVLAGVVVLSFVGADRERNLQTEAVRLAALVELARTEATIRNTRMGLFVDDAEYAFATFEAETGDWVRPEEGPFRPRTAPEGVSFSAATETLELPAGPAPRRARRALPDILIFASGEQTPFTIEVVPAWGSTPWLVHSDGIQRTVANRAGEDAA